MLFALTTQAAVTVFTHGRTDDTLILTAAIAAFDELIARCRCRGSILQSWPGRYLGT